MTDDLRAQAVERVGRILQGKWRLDELIGVGGTASVYAATHRNHKRAALKMLHREVSRNAEIRERFLREGYVANTVGHPGAVSVLDDDVSEEGLAFLVMELLEGQTLEELWESAGRQVAPLVVLTWVDALLDVLTTAHAKGIVHRDLKPENLFMTQAAQLKVLDFGIARAFESVQGEGITKTGFVMGTPAFMAPEQALAHWEEVDERTDLWAVGATMFTLLTGRHVHEGTTGQEVMIRAATQPAVPLADVVPGIPAAVATIVDRAVSFDRDARWSDAKSMRVAVQAALAFLKAKEAAGEPLSISPLPSVSLQAPALTTSATSARSAAVRAAATATLLEQPAVAVLDALTNAVPDAPDPASLGPALVAALASAQAEHAAARTRAQAIAAELAAARAERTALDERRNRQLGTRTAGVSDAQVALQKALAAFGRRALADVQTFGPELAASRAGIEVLVDAANAREREVRLHEAAIASYDATALKKGYAVGGLALFVVLAALFGPLLYRTYVGVEPPPLHPASTDTP